MNISEAFSLSFFISSICIFLLLHFVFEWSFITDLFIPKNWRFFKMKKMRERRDTPLSGQGLSKEKREALEGIINPLIQCEESLLPARMDKTFRKEIEHQLKFFKKRNIRREFYFAGVSSPGNFTKWNDGGREWREVEMDASVLEKIITNSGDAIKEIYHPHAAMLFRQSRRIRHDDRKESKQQYYNEAVINCPSCGAEVALNSQEVHCPYCGAFVTHNFFDWQAESFDFYDKIGNTTKLLLISLGLWEFVFLGLGIAFSLYSVSKILTIALIVGVIALPICLIWFAGSKQKALQKKIVRYSESYLRTCINEELWQKEDKTDLLSFSVNRIKLKSVNNRDDQTYITLQTCISRTFINSNGQLINKKENISLCMNRVKNPSRIKAKGEVFAEKECPSCGANFMPDENNNCSYCGYGLQVYNGRWKLVENRG